MKKIFHGSFIALSIVFFLSLSFSMQNKTQLRHGDFELIPKIEKNTVINQQDSLQTFYANPDFLRGAGPQETAQIQLGDYTSTIKSRSILAVDVDNDSKQEIIADFGATGLWLYDSYRSPNWQRLSTKDAEFMIAADRNGDGSFEIYVSWGSGNGSEFWEDGSGWVVLGNPDWHDYFFCSMDWDDDGKDEIVVASQHTTVPVFTFNILKWGTNTFYWNVISSESTTASQSVDFNVNAGRDELVTYFAGSPKLRWWNWQLSDSDYTDNWTSMTDAYVDIVDCTKAEIGDDAEEEFIVDIYSPLASTGTWIYNYSSSPKWTRINAMDLLDIRTWPRATNSNDELVCSLYGIDGLWYYAPQDYTKWKRLNGLTPDTDKGFVEVFNYDSDSDWDIAVDFKETGLWKYDHYSTPHWTSMNGSDPRYMIRANLDYDSDDELIVVFESSPAGIWIWDNGSTPKWQRINGATPD